MEIRKGVDIYNIDCIAFMNRMQDNSVSLAVTDIPYAEVNRESNGLRNLDKGGGLMLRHSI